MKLFKSIILSVAGLMTFASCTDWLDVNEDPNTPAQAAVSVKTLLPWIQYHLAYATGAHGYRSQFICRRLLLLLVHIVMVVLHNGRLLVH